MTFEFDKQPILDFIKTLEDYSGKPMEQWGPEEQKRIRIKLKHTETGEPIEFSQEEQDELIYHAKKILQILKRNQYFVS